MVRIRSSRGPFIPFLLLLLVYPFAPVLRSLQVTKRWQSRHRITKQQQNTSQSQTILEETE